MIEFREGDLFGQTELDGIGHGVNCASAMGAGIALQFRRRFPLMYRAYREECSVGGLSPGKVMPYWLPSHKVIYNLATQDMPGRRARIEWVAQAVTEMLRHATQHRLTSVGIPRIGAGLGGLVWSEVRKTLIEIAEPSPVLLVVVSPPEPAGSTAHV